MIVGDALFVWRGHSRSKRDVSFGEVLMVEDWVVGGAGVWDWKKVSQIWDYSSPTHYVRTRQGRFSRELQGSYQVSGKVNRWNEHTSRVLRGLVWSACVREEKGMSLRRKRGKARGLLVGKGWGMGDLIGIITGLWRTVRRATSDYNKKIERHGGRKRAGSRTLSRSGCLDLLVCKNISM
jgi:hypothetical protein